MQKQRKTSIHKFLSSGTTNSLLSTDAAITHISTVEVSFSVFYLNEEVICLCYWCFNLSLHHCLSTSGAKRQSRESKCRCVPNPVPFTQLCSIFFSALVVLLPNSQTIHQRWRGAFHVAAWLKAASETTGLTARQKNSEVVMREQQLFTALSNCFQQWVCLFLCKEVVQTVSTDV